MRDLNTLSLQELFEAMSCADAARAIAQAAVLEDLGPQRLDVTSDALLPAGEMKSGQFVAREAGVVAGLRVLPSVIAAISDAAEITMLANDGDRVEPGSAVARLTGDCRCLLAIERTALNALNRLSGIATTTSHYVDAASKANRTTPVRICDTRKTTPGWRSLEKYSVRCGGGWLHRIGLYDAMLVKDNHLAALPDESRFDQLAEAIRRARRTHELSFVEVEADSLDQLRALLQFESGLVDIVLLDNMNAETLQKAVRLRDEAGASMQLEASGGVSLDDIPTFAATGVDRISIGALTHSSGSLDFGFDLDEAPLSGSQSRRAAAPANPAQQ